MKRLFPAVVTLVTVITLLAAAAHAQTPVQEPRRTIAVDIKIIDVDARTPEEIERLVKDRARLNQMITDGKARVFAATQVKVLSGEQNTSRSSYRIPVPTVGNTQVQYENVGFNVTVLARLLPNNTIETRLSLDWSFASGDRGAPTFIQRSLNDVTAVKPDETYVVFNQTQSDAMFPPSPNKSTADALRGNFCVMVTARFVD